MTVATAIELDASQIEAFERVTKWLSARLVDPKLQQVFRLGGHAGSGKTTMLGEVVRYCEAEDIRFRLVTPTGKAADVLHRKGMPTAQTLHSLIYRPNNTAIAEARRIADMIANAELTMGERAVLREELKAQRANRWSLRTDLDGVDLLIIDEASMVSGNIANQLRSFGRPILAVGDPAQLPPVELSPRSEPLFYQQPADYRLEGKHRFGSLVVLGAVADAARVNAPIPAEVIKSLSDVTLTDFDVILVHSNANRWKYIHAVRGALGKPLDRPEAGDRITFWKNNRDFGVFNGGIAVVLTVSEADNERHPAWDIIAKSDDGEVIDLVVDQRGFTNQHGLTEAYDKSDVVVACHSEALTVHKAQGSSWERVLVADHQTVGDGETKVRWRYTAVTRASETLVLAHEAFRSPVKLARGAVLPSLG